MPTDRTQLPTPQPAPPPTGPRILLSAAAVADLANGAITTTPAGPHGQRIALDPSDFPPAAINALRAGGETEVDGYSYRAGHPQATDAEPIRVIAVDSRMRCTTHTISAGELLADHDGAILADLWGLLIQALVEGRAAEDSDTSPHRTFLVDPSEQHLLAHQLREFRADYESENNPDPPEFEEPDGGLAAYLTEQIEIGVCLGAPGGDWHTDIVDIPRRAQRTTVGDRGTCNRRAPATGRRHRERRPPVLLLPPALRGPREPLSAPISGGARIPRRASGRTHPHIALSGGPNRSRCAEAHAHTRRRPAIEQQSPAGRAGERDHLEPTGKPSADRAPEQRKPTVNGLARAPPCAHALPLVDATGAHEHATNHRFPHAPITWWGVPGAASRPQVQIKKRRAPWA
jgi:hypothetical protein